MKRMFLGSLALVLLLGSCGKKDDNNPAPSQSQVMFVHAALDVDSLRAKVNSNVIRTIAFRGNTGYVSVDPSSSAEVSFVYTGSGSTFKSSSMALVTGTKYSVFAGGDANQKIMVTTSDDLAAPAAGKARVRFVNLSPDNIDAVAYVGVVTLDSNIHAGTITQFREVEAGTQNITVGVLPAVASLPSQTLLAGKSYTFVFSGTFSGSGNTGLSLTPITNN